MQSISLKLEVLVAGRKWRLFSVEFRDADGRTYSFYIYATSREHASYVVEDICNTARLSEGDIVSFEPVQEEPMRLVSCVGKGGVYMVLGESTGAGTSRGETRIVYQDTTTGRLFHRVVDDFNARMEDV